MLRLMIDLISTKSADGVLTLSLNRPTKMNALTREMYGALAHGLNEAAGDFSIRAVIISSEGDHFTAGNDIKDFMARPWSAFTVSFGLNLVIMLPQCGGKADGPIRIS